MYKKLYTFIILPLLVILLLDFTLSLNPTPGNWYQQFMPNLGNKQITDITFIDSLTGYSVASASMDSSYVLKTVDGGNSWQIIHRQLQAMTRLKFFNIDTGYACGGYLYRTNDGGQNWIQLNTPSVTVEDMQVLNKDTIWFANSNSLVGGVYFTSNGGASWVQQFSGGNQNPNKIYMYNARIGFMSNSSALPNIYKTINGGGSWTVNVNGESFFDMCFVDSLTGWRASGGNVVYKTTDGGSNWITQNLPTGGNIILSQMYKFGFINRDTIWGCGGAVNYGGGQYRGILYRTTNGGINWLYQIPDTSFEISVYGSVQFINKNIGWAYLNGKGIHTLTGGDTNWLTAVKQISNKIPADYKLFQNYPNPFNPTTVIGYTLKVTGFVTLKIFDITGKHVIDLLNQKQSMGTYEVDFSGNGYSSGVYFYSLIVNGALIDTKKMILLK